MSTFRIQLHVTNVDYKRKDPVFWIEIKVILLLVPIETIKKNNSI
jgi:hypothetical protein